MAEKTYIICRASQPDGEYKDCFSHQKVVEADNDGNIYRISMYHHSLRRVYLLIYKYNPTLDRYDTIGGALPMTSFGDDYETGTQWQSASMYFDANREVLYITYTYQNVSTLQVNVKFVKFNVANHRFYGHVTIATNVGYYSRPDIVLDAAGDYHIVFYNGADYKYFESSGGTTVTVIASPTFITTGISICYNGSVNNKLCIYTDEETGKFFVFNPGAALPAGTTINLINGMVCADDDGGSANFHIAGTYLDVIHAEIDHTTLAITYTVIKSYVGENLSINLCIRAGGNYVIVREADHFTINVYKSGVAGVYLIANNTYHARSHAFVHVLKNPLPATGIDVSFLYASWIDICYPASICYAWHYVDDPIIAPPTNALFSRTLIMDMNVGAWTQSNRSFLCADIFRGEGSEGEIYIGDAGNGYIYQKDKSEFDNIEGVNHEIDSIWRSKQYDFGDGSTDKRFRFIRTDVEGENKLYLYWNIDRAGKSGRLELDLTPGGTTKWDENSWDLLDAPTFDSLIDGALEQSEIYHYKYLLYNPDQTGRDAFIFPSGMSLRMTTGTVVANEDGIRLIIPAYADAVTAGYTTIYLLRTKASGSTFYWVPGVVTTGWDGTAYTHDDIIADVSLTVEYPTARLPGVLTWISGEVISYSIKKFLNRLAKGKLIQYALQSLGRDEYLKIIALRQAFQKKTLH